MGLTKEPIQELADEHGVDVAAVRELLATLRERVGAEAFYVFWTARGTAQSAGARRERTLLAFQTPDAALTFAQRNRLQDASQPRLRRLLLIQLVRAALREPAITAIVFIVDYDDRALSAGRLPPGLRVERADLLKTLRPAR